MKNILSNSPPKGTSDWIGDEFKIRKYIFDTWRRVCLRYGYQEYLTPIVENAEIYKAKSGEDVGGKELITFFDKAGRELAIRPEMTPSITRLISKIYSTSQKPLRYFSIANFMRSEKPQKGRNREFWQLNFDIFGSNSIYSDIEILQIAIDILLEFKPPKNSFILYINNRKLIDEILNIIKLKENQKKEIVIILDKWEKLSSKDIKILLKERELNDKQIDKLFDFMESKNIEELEEKIPEIKDNEGLGEIKKILSVFNNLGYKDLIEFKANIIRGFEYYNGMVFEVFDKNPKNVRSLFGGGRYNGLGEIFGASSFPAVGCAPGDETTKIFLENWGLIDKILEKTKLEKYFFPILSNNIFLESKKLEKELRKQGKNIEMGLEEQNIRKALDYANKKNFQKFIILGEDEIKKGIYKIKDMETGEEKEIGL